MIGPLKAARERGATVRLVPFARARERGRAPRTTLVVCSHVGWVSGELAPGGARAGRRARDARRRAGLRRRAGRRAARSTAPPTPPPARSGCAAADGTGMLYVSPRWRERIRPVAPSYISFEDTTRGLESPYKADARRYDTPSLSREVAALSLGALEVLERHGFDEVLAPRPRAGRRARARGSRRPATPSPRAATARSSPGRTPTPRPRATGCATRASSSATSPGARCCAPRSAPGTTTRDLERLLAALTPDTRAWRGERAAEDAPPVDRQVTTCLSSSPWATSSRPWPTPRAGRSWTSWPSATGRRCSSSARA